MSEVKDVGGHGHISEASTGITYGINFFQITDHSVAPDATEGANQPGYRHVVTFSVGELS